MGDDGRPDIVFDFGENVPKVIVEVKVRSSCLPTALQINKASGSGYRNRGEVYFLVPGGWKHRDEVTRSEMRL